MGRRHVGISRWPEPIGGERGLRAPDPASSGQIVTCSGNTPAGFQAGGGVDNLTVNVLPGATVSDGGGVIIGVNDFNTFTNSGTLSAGPNSTGIFAGVNNTIFNAASGVITLGDDGVGIFAAGNSTVTNVGAITIGNAAGPLGAIVGINDDNTVSNLAGATITGGLNVDGILMQGNRAIVNNAGMINVTGSSAAIDVFGDDALVTSTGLLNIGSTGAAIATQGDRALITHSGTINGGVGSVGVAYNGTSGTINQSGGMLLGDDAFGVLVLGDSNTIANSGTITVGALRRRPRRHQFRRQQFHHQHRNDQCRRGRDGHSPQRQRHCFQLRHDQCRDGFRRDRILRLRHSVLTLGPGSVINGLVLGTGTDTFQLGGTGKDTFNLSLIGAGQQYDGFSTFNKVDSSNWTVTGTGAQDWNVLGGTLSVNGVINGLVTVNAGGTLGGTGTIDNVVVNGGMLAPGNSIGTLNVAGSLTFSAASSYMVEISGASSDLTQVAGAATLGGATVVVVPTGTVTKQYTILTATGGVPDTFNPVVSGVSPNLNPSLSYDANNVYLNFALNYGGGLNVNQQNVANALTNFFNTHRRHSGWLRLALAGRPDAGLGRTGDRIAAGDLRRHEPVPVADDRSVRRRAAMAASVAMQARSRSPKRARSAYAAKKPRAARDAFAKFPTKARCRAQRSVRSALERLGLRLRRRQHHHRQCRAGIERRDRARVRFCGRRRLSPLARHAGRFCARRRRHQFQRQRFRLRALGSVPGRRLHSPQHRRGLCHRRRGLWLAGRDHRAHGHGGRLRAPARPVQRQCVFRPHRGRLPLS